MMHEYLMEVRHFFLGYERFTIKARNKPEALAVARLYVLQEPRFSWGGNYDTNDVRLVMKLKPKKGKRAQK